MRDIPTATLSGNLTREVELNELPSDGESRGCGSRATPRRRSGEEWVETTSYFTEEVYGAQGCAQYVGKGSRVIVDAELHWCDRRPQGRCRAGSQRPADLRQHARRCPLMQADPHVGIELPLRMLIRQDADGTHVGYLDPRELAGRYALDGHQQTLERQAAALTKLGAAAAS